MNKEKFFWKTGGRQSEQKFYNALKLMDYIKALPSNKMYGIVKGRGVMLLTKGEVIMIEKITNKIKVLEKLQKEFPNNDELRIKIIAYKELLEENK